MKKSVFKKAVWIVIGNIVVFALLFGMVELSLYLMYAHLPKEGAWLLAARDYYRAHDADVIQYNHECAQYDPTLAYTLKPGTSVFKNREFHTTVKVNSAGARDDEGSLDAPEIIFLGDSHTMGWGTEGDETYEYLLEKKLGVKCLNAGISSYGTARATIFLQRVDRSNLKALVVQYASNDGYENKKFVGGGYHIKTMDESTYLNMSYVALKRVRPYELGDFIRNFIPRYTSIKKKMLEQAQKNDSERRLEKAIVNNRKEAANFLNILAHGPVDVTGVPIFVFELNENNGLDTLFIDGIHETLASAPEDSRLRQLDIRTIDVSPALTDDDFFVLDHHLKASGHQVIADLLTDKLQKQLSLK